MKPCPFKIGDKVTNRKIGPPVCGVVEAAAFPALRCLVAAQMGGAVHLPTWRETYEGSLDDWTVLVMWDNCEAEERESKAEHPDSVGRGRTGRWFPVTDLILFEAALVTV